MRTLVSANLAIKTPPGGKPLRLEQCVGNGATGEVWAARFGGEPVAVKWYFPHAASSQLRDQLERLTKRPLRSNPFYWPTDVVELEPADGAEANRSPFGIVMPWRPERFRSLQAHIHDAVSAAAITLLLAGIGFCRVWRDLAAQGIVLTDLSLKDLLFDPNNGEVCLSNPEGMPFASFNETPASAGANALTAPGVVAGRDRPSVRANDHALAAVLLALLVRARPDVAPHLPQRFTSVDDPFAFAAISETAGGNDARTRTRTAARWLGLPRAMRDLFTAALGPDRPGAPRPTPADWICALTDFRDALLVCPVDQVAFAALRNPATRTFDEAVPCPACGTPRLAYPQVLLTDSSGNAAHAITLTPNCPMIFADRTHPDGDPLTRVGLLRPHPTEAGIFGFVNLDSEPAHWTAANGVSTIVSPGKPVRVAAEGVLTQRATEARFATAPPSPIFGPKPIVSPSMQPAGDQPPPDIAAPVELPPEPVLTTFDGPATDLADVVPVVNIDRSAERRSVQPDAVWLLPRDPSNPPEPDSVGPTSR